MAKVIEKEQIVLNRKYVEELERKASILEEISSFLEDKYLGHLMEKTERGKNIPFSKIKKILSK